MSLYKAIEQALGECCDGSGEFLPAQPIVLSCGGIRLRALNPLEDKEIQQIPLYLRRDHHIEVQMVCPQKSSSIRKLKKMLESAQEQSKAMLLSISPHSK